MNRRAELWAAIFAIVALVYCIWYAFHDRVTLDNYACIKMDMAKSEIHRLLGGLARGPDQISQLPKWRVRETWIGANGTIQLYFDENDNLFWMEWKDAPPRGFRE